MRKGFGVCCIILGICCLVASVGFIVYNRWEAENAQNVSKDLLQNVRENMQNNTREESSQDESVEISMEVPQEMLTTQVSGNECIGVLSIPVLELELPVLTDWDYVKLRMAPCHYFGSYYEKDFVIAAHNYRSHFGRLSELQPKDLVLFTDVSGTVHCYEVVLLETLPGNATEEMITSGFDLSLYTCTPGGANRVTVRCNTIAAL
jgi:sortase A